MRATVTAQGQLAILKPVRDLLGIAPGSIVDFRAQKSGARYSCSLMPASRFARLRGYAGEGLSTNQIMALTPGEV